MITKEDAIKAIKKCCMFDGETPQMIWSTDAMDAIRGLPDQGEWISVEDRLPEKSMMVLACTHSGNISVQTYSAKWQAFNAHDTSSKDAVEAYNVNHLIAYWMPLTVLPEPPEGFSNV